MKTVNEQAFLIKNSYAEKEPTDDTAITAKWFHGRLDKPEVRAIALREVHFRDSRRSKLRESDGARSDYDNLNLHGDRRALTNFPREHAGSVRNR